MLNKTYKNYKNKYIININYIVIKAKIFNFIYFIK